MVSKGSKGMLVTWKVSMIKILRANVLFVNYYYVTVCLTSRNWAFVI